MDQFQALFNSNNGIFIVLIGMLVLFWIVKKVVKMAIGLALLGALIYFLTNGS